jgi:phosphoglycerate dehydrogenase-like enzyme
MLNLAILDDYLNHALSLADWGRVQDKVSVRVFDRHIKDPDDLAEALSDFEVIVAMRERTKFDAGLLDRLPKLKLIITTGMRNLGIDMEHCVQKGVMVCGTRSASPPVSSTAELAWAHILSLNKGMVRADESMRGGRWQSSLSGTLSGKVLGVLGLGKIGSQVARIGLAFGIEVIAWSQNLTPEKAAQAGALAVSKEQLFRDSDILTLHVLSTERTRHIVSRSDLALMKPSAFLINTARSALVDQAALLSALRGRKIAGAGLDVYPEEPVPADDPLLSLDNVSVTPHLGYATEDNFKIYYHDVLEDLMAWLKGSPVRVMT